MRRGRGGEGMKTGMRRGDREGEGEQIVATSDKQVRSTSDKIHILKLPQRSSLMEVWATTPREIA
jgi:hypothetical protein